MTIYKLEVTQVCKSYGRKDVLRGIDLAVAQGETVAVVGASGVGKTTLFHVIAGATPPDSGHVRIDGVNVTGCSGYVGYMQQKDLLLPYKTVLDNVALPLLIQGAPKAQARETAGRMFAQFGLAGCEALYPQQLSGGMRQRAALLRTHFLRKDVLLLDEPFSALDAMTKTAMHAWYTGIAAQLGMTTLLITHDIDEAIVLGDRVVVLGGAPGRVVDVVDTPTHGCAAGAFALSEAFLGHKRRITGVLASGKSC